MLMKHKALRRLNQKFAAFGDNIHGQPNYKWVKLKDLFYLIETGGFKEGRTPAGIYFMQPVWERHSYAEIHGSRWVLAKWEPPGVDEAEWYRQFSGMFPWPRHGEYHPIEDTILPAGVEPAEQLTDYTVFILYQHLGMKYPDHLRRIMEAANQQKDRDKAWWSDGVDEMMPAFGNVPGQKMHVSFPNVQPHLNRRVQQNNA